MSTLTGQRAGSTNAIGYLSGDRGRSYKVLTDHALRSDFMSFKRYATAVICVT